MIRWMALKACYLAIANCIGAPHPYPPMPHIIVIPDQATFSQRSQKIIHGFACGEYCLNPPPVDQCKKWPCVVPPGYCTETATAYCSGNYDNPPSWGVVTVTDDTFAAIPHEFIHHLVQKKHMFPQGGKADPGDGDHEGPWWHCDGKGVVPECARFWMTKTEAVIPHIDGDIEQPHRCIPEIPDNTKKGKGLDNSNSCGMIY